MRCVSCTSAGVGWFCHLGHLLSGGASSSLDRLRLLPGGRSRDSTMYIFLHQLWSTTSSQWTFEGRHYMYLPTPTVVHDFEQLTMSGSRATGALSMGPSAGYISILKLVKFNLFFVMINMMFINIFVANMRSSKITHVHIFFIIILLLFFWINFNMKLPKFLTYIHTPHYLSLIIKRQNFRLFFSSIHLFGPSPFNYRTMKSFFYPLDS
jgi:hypothetical protein